jgi:hypothetical protein
LDYGLYYRRFGCIDFYGALKMKKLTSFFCDNCGCTVYYLIAADKQIHIMCKHCAQLTTIEELQKRLNTVQGVNND